MANTTYFSRYFPVSHQHTRCIPGLTPQDEDGSQCPGVTVLTGPSSYDLYQVNTEYWPLIDYQTEYWAVIGYQTQYLPVIG